MHTDGTGIEPLSGTSVISCIDLFNAYRNVSKPLCELPLLDISDSESAMRGIDKNSFRRWDNVNGSLFFRKKLYNIA
jgi:hypothetical protein